MERRNGRFSPSLINTLLILWEPRHQEWTPTIRSIYSPLLHTSPGPSKWTDMTAQLLLSSGQTNFEPCGSILELARFSFNPEKQGYKAREKLQQQALTSSVGKQAPEFNLASFNGPNIRLSDL